MPGWMSGYPEKKRAFERYGSPNVFHNFDPHITLIANGDGMKIEQFLSLAVVPTQKFKVIGIGVSAVDEFGQFSTSLSHSFFPNSPTF